MGSTDRGELDAPQHRNGGEKDEDIRDDVEGTVGFVEDLLLLGADTMPGLLPCGIPELGRWNARQHRHEYAGNREPDGEEH